MKLIPRIKPKTSVATVGAPDVFSKLQTEMDSMFDRFFKGSWGAPLELFASRGGWGLSVDVVDSDKEVVVKADVPGVDPKDLDISLAGNTLVISGEKKEEHEEKGKHYFRSERAFGSFRRSVELPAAVDAEKVKANYSNGVLTVRLDKHESVKPKKIAVR